MNNTLETLLNSVQYVVGEIPQVTPSKYLNPIIDMLGNKANLDASVVKLAKPVSIGRDNEKETSYGRIAIEIPLLDNRTDYANMKLGLVVAVDKKEPIYKVAIGNELFACTNLMLVGDSVLTTNNISELISMTEKHLQNTNMFNDLFYEFKNKYEKISMSIEEVEKYCGRLIINSDDKLRNTIANGFYNVINSPTSPYYQEQTFNPYNLFNSTTQEITNSFTKGSSERISNTYNLYNAFTTNLN